MAGFIRKVLKLSALALVVPAIAFAAQQQNPRNTPARENVRSADIDSNAALRRSATSVIARSAAINSRNSRTVVTARPATVRTASVRSVRPVTSNTTKSRVASKPMMARSGVSGSMKQSGANLSRAGTARATAVFNDITKIGGGYSDCRDSYATCMDQFCANANETYRRCFCSDRFQNFRETADKLDTALQMLAEFQDNNLNAVDKTAAEVNAMYTATAGEEAIKKDTSASQKLLNSISDVLSGKQTQKQSLSLGVLDLSGFGSGSDDIFGATSSSFFGDSTTNLADLEGKALYDNALKQCVEVTRASCGSDAMFNLAKSAYSIMVTQDCNLYEKNINAKKASVEETVRTAEKYLRDARLEEYRSHNSQDVNECLAKVEDAIKQSTACGPNYEKCMDYTGLYVNANTGEPILSQALFKLNTIIVLDGSADVLKANPEFNKNLESKKMFAETALDTCRDKADVVWNEFKRAALIHIAQAQDDMIQKVKDSCVTTIKECYDTQTGAMKDFDTTKMQSTDAIAAVTARGMCYDRVQACAALYGDPDGCKYDDKTKKLTAVKDKKCGLQSLLTFVDTVDSVKVAEGCEAALTKYAHELCDEDIGTKNPVKYGKCKTMPEGQLRAAMDLRMNTFCAQDLVINDESNTVQEQNAFNTNIMNQLIKNIYDELGIQFTAGCEHDKDFEGTWVSGDELENPSPTLLVQEFYQKYYGTTITSVAQIDKLNLKSFGWCINKSVSQQCDALGPTFATFDTQNAKCVLSDDWYQYACEVMLKAGEGAYNKTTGICTIADDEGTAETPVDEQTSSNSGSNASDEGTTSSNGSSTGTSGSNSGSAVQTHNWQTHNWELLDRLKYDDNNKVGFISSKSDGLIYKKIY